MLEKYNSTLPQANQTFHPNQTSSLIQPPRTSCQVHESNRFIPGRYVHSNQSQNNWQVITYQYAAVIQFH